jgi:hypothetical protein
MSVEFEMHFVVCERDGCFCGGVTVPLREIVSWLSAIAADLSQSNPSPAQLTDAEQGAVEYARRVVEHAAGSLMEYADHDHMLREAHGRHEDKP